MKIAKLLLQKDVNIGNVFEKVNLSMMLINMTQLHLLSQISRHLAIQGIAFRGHDENENSLNRDKFLKLLELIKVGAPELANHITNLPKNALYTSSNS